MTKYIKIMENGGNNTHIKITFDYDLGGMNYFTGRTKKRGYYLTVYPVQRDGDMEGFTAFTGVSECIQECTRKSTKAETAAREKMPAYEKIMVEYITKKYGYIIEGAQV